ncbi:MAG: T9SS type A sorting domain-containing protein [Flavobacteriales bacterium]|nr:T9SS type A sorting domain-containing protein [Flavobacteriales bacterium]
MKYRFTLLFALAFTCLLSQSSAVLDINNAHALVNVNSVFFNDSASSMANFEVPAGNDVHTIYANRFWIGGVGFDEQLKLAAGTYGPNLDGSTDFYPGPLTIDGTASTNQETMEAYARVWKVNQADVIIHKAYFDAIQNGTVEIEFPDGYEIPEYFMDWPAHGDVEQGFDIYVAPFCDYDEDGLYNPSNGDAPMICGDQAIYLIMNDNGGSHLESGGQQIGVEIHVMVYGFDASESFLDNTVFAKYKIINRSNQTLQDALVAVWTDMDIGGSADDYVGTQVQLGAVYGHNSDAFDEPVFGSAGYGSSTPAQAVQILAGPRMDADGTDNIFPGDITEFETNSYGPYGSGFGDGIPDNERLGLSNSMQYQNSSNPMNGEMTAPIHYYNYMRSIYLSGEALAVNDSTVVQYSYYGDSDPWHLNNDYELPLWTEASDGNPGGDRRVIASSGQFTLAPGDIEVLDVAYVYAEESGSGMEELEWLEHELTLVKNFFDENLIDCPDAGSDLPSQIAPQSEASSFQVFPNPTRQVLNVVLPNNGATELVITDVQGKIAKTASLSGGIGMVDVSGLCSGMYMVRIVSTENFETKVFRIE